MRVKPSIEGLRHLRSQGWTFAEIEAEYELRSGEAYLLLSGLLSPASHEADQD